MALRLARALAALTALAAGEVRLRSQNRLQSEDMPWQDIPIEKPKESQCGPKCHYQCQQSNCPAAQCAPLCDPPQCKTSCSAQRDHCETRCGEPLCAVVCPQAECKGNDCGNVKCQTVCSPPVCTTSCAETCQTHCAKPKCQWRCKANPSCPAPSCKMTCTDLDCATSLSASNKTAAELKNALLKDGKVIVAEGHAHLNPQVLVGGAPAAAPAAPAAPAENATAAPVKRKAESLKAASAPAAAPAAAPVASPAAAPAGPAEAWGQRPVESSWWDFLSR